MLLTVDGWMQRALGGTVIAVTVDGENVTRGCVAADDVEGYAVLLEGNDDGKLFMRHRGDCPNGGGWRLGDCTVNCGAATRVVVGRVQFHEVWIGHVEP